jgi:acyl-coenzyme A thioesterase PaaI-like protein
MNLAEALALARRHKNIQPLVDAIPYARFMGMQMRVEAEEIIGVLAYTDDLIGNPRLPALHGGTLGALLESTAIFKMLWQAETVAVPKTINITVQYLRSGKPRDTFARADITRAGRRIATVRAIAWQEDLDRPIAAANAHFLLEPTE